MKTCTVRIVMFGSTRILRWNNIWALYGTKTLSLGFQSPHGPIKSSPKNQGQIISINVSCVMWRWIPRFNSSSTCAPSDTRQHWRVNRQNRDGSHMNDSESNKDYKLSWWVKICGLFFHHLLENTSRCLRKRRLSTCYFPPNGPNGTIAPTPRCASWYAVRPTDVKHTTLGWFKQKREKRQKKFKPEKLLVFTFTYFLLRYPSNLSHEVSRNTCDYFQTKEVLELSFTL